MVRVYLLPSFSNNDSVLRSLMFLSTPGASPTQSVTQDPIQPLPQWCCRTLASSPELGWWDEPSLKSSVLPVPRVPRKPPSHLHLTPSSAFAPSVEWEG